MAFRRFGTETLVVIDGELDMSTAPAVARVLTEAVAEADAADISAKRLAVDLSGVGFIDSWGLEPVARLSHILRRRGITVEIVAPSPPVHRLLDVLDQSGLLAGSPPVPWAR